MSPERARLLRRIRALWALANHQSTPAEESKSARRLAGRLMFIHRITAAEVEGTHSPASSPPPVRVVVVVQTVTFNGAFSNNTTSAGWISWQ